MGTGVELVAVELVAEDAIVSMAMTEAMMAEGVAATATGEIVSTVAEAGAAATEAGAAATTVAEGAAPLVGDGLYATGAGVTDTVAGELLPGMEGYVPGAGETIGTSPQVIPGGTQGAIQQSLAQQTLLGPTTATADTSALAPTQNVGQGIINGAMNGAPAAETALAGAPSLTPVAMPTVAPVVAPPGWLQAQWDKMSPIEKMMAMKTVAGAVGGAGDAAQKAALQKKQIDATSTNLDKSLANQAAMAAAAPGQQTAAQLAMSKAGTYTGGATVAPGAGGPLLDASGRAVFDPRTGLINRARAA